MMAWLGKKKEGCTERYQGVGFGLESIVRGDTTGLGAWEDGVDGKNRVGARYIQVLICSVIRFAVIRV